VFAGEVGSECKDWWCSEGLSRSESLTDFAGERGVLFCALGMGKERFGWMRKLAGWLCLALSGAVLVALETLTAW
jgi:hypothetical protein